MKVHLRRTGIRHMAFGLVPYRCPGSHHGRMVLRVMLGPVVRFADAGDVYAIKSLPITFTPGATSA